MQKNTFFLLGFTFLSIHFAHAEKVTIDCPLNPTEKSSDYEFEWIEKDNHTFDAKMKILPRDLGSESHLFESSKPISWDKEGKPVIKFAFLPLPHYNESKESFSMVCTYAVQKEGTKSVLAMKTQLPKNYTKCKHISKFSLVCEKQEELNKRTMKR